MDVYCLLTFYGKSTRTQNKLDLNYNNNDSENNPNSSRLNKLKQEIDVPRIIANIERIKKQKTTPKPRDFNHFLRSY
ncbi:hypothetical protein CWI36_2593p0010 [Hamiltosporidium magnivora]|uniref:Uncharacterized protein n=1 Tax=Hamiltosporidium magnivora TaxID=148818 RepID=A0A4Q9KT49_9MICR|nr:hypothetical protein CWI36_2593p0010 [Hamiltosporidium magnivora]